MWFRTESLVNFVELRSIFVRLILLSVNSQHLIRHCHLELSSTENFKSSYLETTKHHSWLDENVFLWCELASREILTYHYVAFSTSDNIYDIAMKGEHQGTKHKNEHQSEIRLALSVKGPPIERSLKGWLHWKLSFIFNKINKYRNWIYPDIRVIVFTASCWDTFTI